MSLKSDAVKDSGPCEAAAYMLEHNVKLEQEIISYYENMYCYVGTRSIEQKTDRVGKAGRKVRITLDALS